METLEEFVRYPVMIYYGSKGKKFRNCWKGELRKSGKNPVKLFSMKKLRNELLIQYERLDNSFSCHFSDKNLHEQLLSCS